jgi:hypothetical protein
MYLSSLPAGRHAMLRNAVMNLKSKYFFSATLAQTFNKLSSALTGAAITVLALAEPFIAAGAAVAFIRCFFIVF